MCSLCCGGLAEVAVYFSGVLIGSGFWAGENAKSRVDEIANIMGIVLMMRWVESDSIYCRMYS